MRLPLSRIRTDGGTQPRAAMNEPTVAEYAEAMTEGAKFPPVVVFHDGEQHWLAEGFHRVAAARRIGALDIECEVKPGTRRDAQLFSFSANSTHGLRRSVDDKRRCVRAMLEDADWALLSNREIAKACAVSHTFVAGLRPIDPAKVTASGNVATPRPVPTSGPVAIVRDPDADLEAELAKAEAEVGARNEEVELLRAQLAAAHETIDTLTAELEAVSKLVDADASIEIKKVALQLRTVERVRDDLQNQNGHLKAEVKRLQNRLDRQQMGAAAA